MTIISNEVRVNEIVNNFKNMYPDVKNLKFTEGTRGVYIDCNFSDNISQYGFIKYEE